MAITISGENNNDKILAQDGVIDQISGINIVGLITASHIDVGSNINLGNAGIVTATTFVGNLTGNVNSTSPLLLQTGGSERFRITGNNELGIAGANYGSSGQVLTSGGSGNAVTWTTPTVTSIVNYADNKLVTATGNANSLNAEAGLTWTGSVFQLTSSGGNQFPFNIRNDFTPNSQRCDFGYFANSTSNNALRLGSVNSNGGVTIQSTRMNDSAQKHNLILNPDGGDVIMGNTNAFNSNTSITPCFSIGSSATGRPGIVIRGNTTNKGDISFCDNSGTDGSNGVSEGLIRYDHATDHMEFHTSDDERVRITSTGQVQLNGATGKSTSGTSATDLLLANGAAIRFRRANDSNWINTIGIDSSDNLKLGWGGSVDEIHFGIAGIGDQMKLDSSGRILLGLNASSTYAFSGGDDLIIGHTSNTRSGITLVSSSDNDGGLYFSRGTSSNSDNVKGQIVYNHPGDYLQFYTASNPRMRIDTNELRFNSTAQQIHLNTSDGSDNGYMNIGAAGGANNQTRGAQVVFYGNEHSSYPGQCGLLAGNSGSTQGHIYFNTGGNTRARIESDGEIEFTTAGYKFTENNFLSTSAATENGNTAQFSNALTSMMGSYHSCNNTNGIMDFTDYKASDWTVLEVYGKVNPNTGGSGAYSDPFFMTIYKGGGYDYGSSSVVTTIFAVMHTPAARTMYSSGSGNNANDGITAVWYNGSSESVQFAHNNTNNAANYLRIKIPTGNFNTTYGMSFACRIFKRF